ncbi:TauD/TfdA dioxygenase family protein [Xylophilus sp.]|uniref:TauD/TfdA dioxygenase family protein n=1 Tax=Xylophilus sp. TaxID=2653893 RepID=UPI0013BA38E3|nr:TauD/TfdA family dioxygenase [Xylophilus sp.]KAF1049195.1 MAG: Alpha-ketoglutarate-dependent taurine dioxygenase [Xylophilus sp.]
MSLAVADDTSLHIRPLTPVIGAEVGNIDLRQPLSAAQVAALTTAVHQWRVLFFRDQPLTDEQQLAFGRAFGPLTPAHPIAEGLEAHPEIWERKAADYKARRPDLRIPSAQPPRDYKGWHIDITFVANPNRYSILRGVDIPAYGGDTLFSNLALAYQGLSEPIKQLIDPLKAVHRTGGYDSAGGGKVRRDGRKAGPFVSLHPLVRVHPETGEKILFVNPGTTSHIVGLKQPESQGILDILVNEITRPEYQVRFHWTPHALVLWDNQAVAHAGPIDYAHFDLPRVVRRITVAGELPQGPDGFRSQPLEGELFDVIG